MNKDNLVKMANNIGSFFDSDPDREAAIEGVKDHLKRFWELRMRIAIIDHFLQGGEGLSETVKSAVSRLAKDQAKLVHSGDG